MLQSQLHAELLGYTDGGADVVRAVSMGLQGDLALQNGDQSFHLHVKLRGLCGIFCGFFAHHIVFCVEQHFTQLGGGGHTGGVHLALIAALGVFAEGALHGNGILDDHVIHAVAVGLDRDKSAAQNVGAARAGANGGHAALEGKAHTALQRVKAVDGAEMAGYNVIHLVIVVTFKAHAVVIQTKMAVGVNEAGVDLQTAGVNHVFSVNGGEVRSDLPDHRTLGTNVGIIRLCMDGVMNESIFNQHW